MLDLATIRGYGAGQRNAFESLVCQLARLEPPSAKAEFRRIEGSGGDGGVEAYWLLGSGQKIGYQAKFFTKARRINWQQIDSSVRTALTKHPTLKRYVVALACDLTDSHGETWLGGRKKRSKGGWNHWQQHRRTWEAWARAKLKHTVQFVPWTASDIQAKLTSPSAAGIQSYWFGNVEASPSWFRKHLASATASLEERYHPEDHVDVTTQLLFELVTRHPASLQKLHQLFDDVLHADVPWKLREKDSESPPKDLAKAAEKSIVQLSECRAAIAKPAWEPWDIAGWRSKTKAATSALQEILAWAWQAKEKVQDQSKSSSDRGNWFISQLQKFKAKVTRLQSFLGLSYFDAERGRVALLIGRAGSGKSHLLAHVAETAMSERRPVIMVLGQQLREQTLWQQIAHRFDLPSATPDELLGALDAAAEAVCLRGLILVDAINEGAGPRLWRNELAAFLTRLSQFPNLACVLSCRTEYVEYVIPETILKSLPTFEIRGFETAAEQGRAAQIYLDKRGISRPATPWLAPEFTNPLFLRSCCNALQKEGKREFPKGLAGTKSILAFFIESVARHLGTSWDGGNDLIAPTKRALLRIASQMAVLRKDYLPRGMASELANHAFEGFAASPETTWLELLQRNGLLRFDPDPDGEADDPMSEPIDAVRFSFQRFQDHLMSAALLAEVVDVRPALQDDGPLSFIRSENQIAPAWHGLVGALSTQLPEKFGVELLDTLPGGACDWWRDWSVFDGFIESIRWRAQGAFSDRTLQLFNAVDEPNQNRLALLIELSAAVDHPWNADFIHRNLISRRMPERDAFWTMELNQATDDDSHPIHRLIDWCKRDQPSSSQETQRLCATVLTWCFALSSRPLRDHATKGLTTILVRDADLFARLYDDFAIVDDLYVLERLFAAAYGASCIDPSPKRLTKYASIAAKAVFGTASPPESLLLRDYARGIIQLADHCKALPPEVDIAVCRPPYRSQKVRFTITKGAIERTAKRAGDDAILHSCEGFFGDFGRYEIAPSVGRFAAVSLDKPVPLTRREIFERFEDEVIKGQVDRESALASLRDALASRFTIIVRTEPKGSNRSQDQRNAAYLRSGRLIKLAEKQLLALLTPPQRTRYRREVLPYLMPSKSDDREVSHIDVAKAARWVASKAYGLGWNKALFSRDIQIGGSSRERPRVERIGKKYQWIALEMLLCRLADSNWMTGAYDAPTRKYDTPLDVGFIRDIDPTVLVDEQEARPVHWQPAPRIVLSDIPDEALATWPLELNPAASLLDLTFRSDDSGQQWVKLYEHLSATSRHIGQRSGLRQQEFRFILSLLVHRSKLSKLIDQFITAKTIDVTHFDPPEFTDGPYLREMPWRSTWAHDRWRVDGGMTPKGVEVAFPVCEYRWESHLDSSLINGASALLPAPWLIEDLGLSADAREIGVFANRARLPVFAGTSPRNGAGSVAVISADLFGDYLRKRSLAVCWLFVGERNAWPSGGMSGGPWRRAEAYAFWDGVVVQGHTWVTDGHSHLHRKVSGLRRLRPSARASKEGANRRASRNERGGR